MKSLLLRCWGSFLRFQDLTGDVPARVYISGLGMASSGTFTRVITDPSLLGYRTVLVDLLGSGFSDRPLEFGYTLEEHALVVAELLDHIGLRRCAVIGHSLGGSVAITLAILRPDLVSNLVVAEANLDPGGGAFSKVIAAQSEEEFMRTGFAAFLERILMSAAEGDESMSACAGMLQVAAPHAVYRSARALVEGIRPAMRAGYNELQIPRAYIYGERSVPRDRASVLPDAPDPKELAAHGIRVLIVPNAGHFMMFDNPAGFAQVLKDALST
jgi:pimeloyl-ACP methyl ester carboxylesterase